MSGLIARVGRSRPRVPVEIADAVEKWARRYGRHARVVFIEHTDPPIPQVRITPMHDDPIRAADIPPEEKEEAIELMEWDEEKGSYVPKDLHELGAQGVIRFLNKGNTFASGEFDSLEEASEEARKSRERAAKKAYRDGKEDARAVGRAVKNQLLDIPKHRTGIDLSEGTSPEAPSETEGD